MKRNTYIPPLTEHIILPTDSIMLTASPGVSTNPYNPSMPVGAKPNLFNEDGFETEQIHYSIWDKAED